VFTTLEVLCAIMCAVVAGGSPTVADDEIKLIPYPQEITKSAGNLVLGPAEYVIPYPSDTTTVASGSLSSYLPKSGDSVTVRLGSVEEGYDKSWLTADERDFLADPATSSEASMLKIASDGITVVGKGKWGMLYGVQTVNQLVRGNDTEQGTWKMKTELPCLVIKDWPDTQWRCLSPTMTWYSGYNRLEGYDLCNWTLDEWKWLVDWSLLHKCNGWAMCMYGNWPFTLPGYDECTLDVDSFHYDPATGKKTAYPFTEARVRNIAITGGGEPGVYRTSPAWNGTLSNLRIDLPKEANVRINSIRFVELPDSDKPSDSDLARPVPNVVRRSAEKPFFIPWENLSDVVPASPTAKQPGLYLSTEIGFDRREDFFRLGVVFTVQTQQAEGKWRTLFRRALERRTTGWEHWDIPLTGGSGSAKLRFTTDSYSRAMDRNAPSWKWALWGRPQLVEVTADGKRRVLYDFVDHVDDCETLVRLDKDGKERAFDGQGEDSTGATFVRVSPSPADLLGSEEGNARQIVDGFADWIEPPPNRGKYMCYLGWIEAGWAYASGRGELSWRTAPVPAERATAVALVGGTGYATGKADLYCNGQKLLAFDMAKPSNQKWEADGVELRYIFGGDTRSETTPYGISGIYVLVLPASKVTAGKPLDLTVMVPPGGGDWFMVHECRSIDEVTRLAICPQPEMPAIAAFTPHKDGKFGVTIAEYEVDLGHGSKAPPANTNVPNE